MVIPVRRHRRPQGGVGLVVPEAAQQPVGLAEPKEVLGEGNLVDAGRTGTFAVVGHLLEGGCGVALAMGPEMEVVVEHGERFCGSAVLTCRPRRHGGRVG